MLSTQKDTQSRYRSHDRDAWRKVDAAHWAGDRYSFERWADEERKPLDDEQDPSVDVDWFGMAQMFLALALWQVAKQRAARVENKERCVRCEVRMRAQAARLEELRSRFEPRPSRSRCEECEVRLRAQAVRFEAQRARIVSYQVPKYWALVEGYRERRVSEVVIRDELKRSGFRANRISDVLTLVALPIEDWQRIRSGPGGWSVKLAQARLVVKRRRSCLAL